ncbi:ATP-binding protein [Streptomyces sp. NPDC012637]|uniref:ATP-binding protein n=1 Tax=Streptomyces sp. NPDC012637 TaxID=3364842 RepID=UPI0036E8EE4A
MFLTRWRLDRLADSAALALTELVANVVRHVPGRRCTVLILREPFGLRVEVSDAVPGPVIAKAADPLAEAGRGLVLVEAVTDRWGCTETALGKTVWFECDAQAVPGQPCEESASTFSGPQPMRSASAATYAGSSSRVSRVASS